MNKLNKKILIVDDDPDCLFQLDLLLINNGYQSVTIGSQAAAIDWLEKNKPDLAIFDLMMDREDSGFILSRLSKKYYTDVPVIILTAVTPETGIRFDLRSQESQSWIKADRYLEKGLNQEALLNHIKQLLK